MDADGDGLADDLMIEIPAVGPPAAIRCPASFKAFLGGFRTNRPFGSWAVVLDALQNELDP